MVQIQDWQRDFTQNYVPHLDTPEGRDAAARAICNVLDERFAPVLMSYSDNEPVTDQINGFVNRFSGMMQPWLPEGTDVDTFIKQYGSLSDDEQRERDFTERLEAIQTVFADAREAFLEAARGVNVLIGDGIERPRRRLRELNTTRVAFAAQIQSQVGSINTRAAELEDRSNVNGANYNQLSRDFDKNQDVVRTLAERLKLL